MSTVFRVGQASIELVQGDITEQVVDAIVNAANSHLAGGGGVDGAIHRAGGPGILAECREIVAREGRCPTGRAVITHAGRLHAKYVIHAVGPRYGEHGRRHEALLESVHAEAMRLAAEARCETVAFPAISTGVYGYPIDEAAPVALRSVARALRAETSIRLVRFVLFDRSALAAFENAARELTSSREPP